MNNRQKFALENPYDYLRDGFFPGFHRDIGKFSTILTIDVRTDFPDMSGGFPEWNASAGLVSSRVLDEMGPLREVFDRGNLPMVSTLLWSEKAWEEAIKFCKTMVRGVGKGEGYWTGEDASLHLRKGLTEEETRLFTEIMEAR